MRSLNDMLKKTLLIVLVIAIVAVACFFTSLFTKISHSTNEFLVINTSHNSSSISVEFPSGFKQTFVLESNKSHQFHVPNTGEGSFLISVNGNLQKANSYVTSYNPPTVILVNEDSHSYHLLVNAK